MQFGDPRWQQEVTVKSFFNDVLPPKTCDVNMNMTRMHFLFLESGVGEGGVNS